MKKSYPFVESTKLTFQGNQTLKVDITFSEPEFLVKLGDKKFGIWEDGISDELDDQRSLGKTGFIVDTPSYLTGTNSLSGFFYEVDYQRYKDFLPAIQEAFPHMNRFVYLAGSASFVIFEENKMIFLYRDNPLYQLQKLAWLRKYYAGVLAAKTPEEAAEALTGTYATDPNYGKKLLDIIDKHGLRELDKEIFPNGVKP